MDKSKINLIIDAVMFLCVMAIAGIGLLQKFILIPGKNTIAVYGRKVDLFLFSMDRHTWGTIHFIIACVFPRLINGTYCSPLEDDCDIIRQINRREDKQAHYCHRYRYCWIVSFDIPLIRKA